MNNSWSFNLINTAGATTLSVTPPSYLPAETETAVWDFLTSDVGNGHWILNILKKEWGDAITHPGEPYTMSGNATSQTLEGDEVLFEPLYGQWEPVRIPKEEFINLLDSYAAFLQASEK